MLCANVTQVIGCDIFIARSLALTLTVYWYRLLKYSGSEALESAAGQLHHMIDRVD